MNPLEALPSELVLQCLEYCLKDFPALSRVSRDWHELLETPSLWWAWLTRIDSHHDGTSSQLRLPTEMTLPAAVVTQTRTHHQSSHTASADLPPWHEPSALTLKAPEIFQNPKLCFKELHSLSQAPSFEDDSTLLMTGLSASSEDDALQTWNQDISQTLDPNPHTFWSSRGNPDPLSREHLVYQLVQPVCIITAVTIVPFRAAFQRGMPTYAPMWITIKAGFHADAESMHYTSREFKVQNRNERQIFPLAPLVVAGGYLRLEMRGRYERQPNDDLYYTVLQHVDAFGYPLGALADYPHIQSALLQTAYAYHTDWTAWFATPHGAAGVLATLEHASAPILRAQRRLAQTRASIEQLIADGDWEWASELMVSEHDPAVLRTDAFLQRVKARSGDGMWSRYLDAVVAKGVLLRRFEALELARKAVTRNSYTQFWSLIESRRVECTEELGDVFYPLEPLFAASIYLRGRVFDKVLDCLVVTQRYEDIIHHMQ
ncbi:hypothetical protein SeLEV6574_g08511 [Synchytrium endobioticum]|uniref:F-box domain-containing protein n=1 Tax=Synchytrium endobioticum TaxID=286115 RepID=A0A507C196_9FUNG|nr:hypothetical protein SeLEV6574_g08511 [Synchytrium endobioticum]